MIQKYWQENIEEIKHLCNLMGLVVISTPGAGSSIAELRESVTASYNVVVYPEYCYKTSEYYKNEFEIPVISSPDGVPAGFTPTETWIKTVASVTGRDPAPALEEIKKYRRHAYHKISKSYHGNRSTKGATFSIRGDSSLVYSLTRWMFEYLGMIPVSVTLLPGHSPEFVTRLEKFFDTHNLSITTIGTDPATVKADLFLGDGLIGKGLVLSGVCEEYIEIYNRSYDHADFAPKTFLGGKGSLWLLEYLFNAFNTLFKQNES